MTTKGTNIRSILSAIMLCCYVMSICQVPIVEGIHFLSHLISGAYSSAGMHSYHAHEGQHNHDSLNIINTLTDQQSDSHNSNSQTDTEKKYQIEVNATYLVCFSEAMIDHGLDHETVFHSLKLSISTPPPQV